MANILDDLSYPFDPTGTLASNRITNEQFVLNAVNYRDYHVWVPRWAPFFTEGMSLTIKEPGVAARPLYEGVDWMACFKFIGASRATAMPIWGGVQFLNNNLTGVITGSYNTIGGVWTIDTAKVAELMAYNLHNPRVTSWEKVVDLPMAFPPIDHEWDLVDMVGMTDVVTALGDIEAAIREAGGGDITAHINNFDNPHRVNKSQVGLDQVQNYPIATSTDVAAGTSNAAYMTPAMTYLMLNQSGGAGDVLTKHIANTSNPHNTTAAQVGAYSKAEIAQLLTGYLTTSGVAADTLKFNGLDENDYKAFVLAGTAANSLTFNGLTPAQYAAQVLGGKAADSDKFAGHTYAEAMADFLSGKAADTFLFNGMDAATYAAWALANGTAGNAAKFNNMTPSDYAAFVLQGKAADSDKLAGLTLQQVEQQILNQIGGAGAVARQTTFPATTGETAGTTYYQELSRTRMPDAGALGSTIDQHWLVTGSGGDATTSSAAYYVRITNKGAAPNQVSMEVTRLSVYDAGLNFGYFVNNLDWQDGAGAVSTLRVCVKTGANIGPISITQLSQDSATMLAQSRSSTVPPNYQDVASDRIGLYSEFTQLAQALTSSMNNLATQLGS